MERIGVFGGSFNPPHLGHIRAASCAMEALGLSRVLLIPASQVPHKTPDDHMPTALQRLEMTRLAARGVPGLEVSDVEVRRGGKSYTCDTLVELRRRYPDASFTLLLGSDMLCCFSSWVNSRKIMDMADIAAFFRGGKREKDRMNEALEQLRGQGARVTLLENPVTEISSTQLRRLLAFRSADSLLPPAVLDYIRENRLYDVGADWKNLPMEELQPIVLRLLNEKRIPHVLGCRDTCVALAQKWGADPVDAARAGLLHDITKALDGPLQLTLCSAYGKILDDFSHKYPKTLHALTGSLVAERIFGEKKAVVDAICSHTTGKPNMNVLETIVYVADYMEPNRDFPGVERLRQLAFEDLYAALRLGLEMTLAHLKEQGAEVSPQSMSALEYLSSR